MNSPIARHFHDCNHDIKDLSCIGIEKVISRRGGNRGKTFTKISLLDVSTKKSPLGLN